MEDRTEFVSNEKDCKGQGKDSDPVKERVGRKDGDGQQASSSGTRQAQPSYFLAKNFRANVKGSKRTINPKGEWESGAHEQMKCLLKTAEERNAVSWVARNDSRWLGGLCPESPKLHPLHSQVSKCNLWDSKVSDTFHKPLQDLLSGSVTHRFSESSSSNQNFRLSNIQSVNDSESDKQQSMLKMSRDWQDTAEQLGDFGNHSSCREECLGEDRRRSNVAVESEGCTLGAAVGSKSDSRVSHDVSCELRGSALSGVPKDDSIDWGNFRGSSSQDFVKQSGPVQEGKHSKSSSSCGSDDLLCKTFDVHPKCVVGNSCLANTSLGPMQTERGSPQGVSLEVREKVSRGKEEQVVGTDVARTETKVPVRSKLQYKKNVHLFSQKGNEESSGNLPKTPPKAKGLKTDNDLAPAKEHSMFSTVDSHQTPTVAVPPFDRQPGFFHVAPHSVPHNFYHNAPQMVRFNQSQNEDELYSQDFSCSLMPSKAKGNDKKAKKMPVRKSHPVDDVSKYAIDVNFIPEDKTTVMIKNIPNRYKKDTMLEMVDKWFSGTYDFFYLPIDLERDANVGYAFLNFKASKTIRQFYSRFSGLKWTSLNSDKVCDVSYARIQGLEACLHHFKDSSLIRNNVS